MLYEYVVRRIAVGSGTTFTQLLGGNSRRRCVIVSANTGTLGLLSVNKSTSLSGVFAHFALPGNIVMPYRDFGPIIQGDIWGNTFIAGTTMSITEIYTTQ